MVCIYAATFFVFTRNALCSQHLPISPASREIIAKKELKLKKCFSKAQEGNALLPALQQTNCNKLEQAEPASKTALHTRQNEVIACTPAPRGSK